MENNQPPPPPLTRKTTSQELIDVVQLKENVLSAVVALDSKIKRRSFTQRNFSQIATLKMEQSCHDLEKKLKNDPSNIPLRKMYANLLSNLERFEESIDQLR